MRQSQIPSIYFPCSSIIHFPHSQGHSVASPFTARQSQLLAEGLYLYIWALNPTRPMPRDDPENVWQAQATLSY